MPRSPAAFALPLVLSIAGGAALDGCGPVAAGDCCACLLLHDEEGATLALPEDPDAPIEGNCVPGEGSYEDENLQCALQASQALQDDDGSDVLEVASAGCLQTACAAECAGLQEAGVAIVLAPGDDGDP